MVLQQKMSAMSEHNTQGAGTNPDTLSAHSKKLSLANKLKKQRKSRQSGGAASPVPNEGPLVASKSPVRESDDNPYPEKTRASKSPIRDNAAASSSSAASAVSTSKSPAASLLHNKRRAMHLAKSRHRPSAKVNASATTAKPEASSEDKASTYSATSTSNANETTGKTTDAYAPYARKMPGSRPGILEPAFSSPKTTTKHNHNAANKEATQRNSAPEVSEHTVQYDHAVTPVESAESQEQQCYEEDINPKFVPVQMRQLGATAKSAKAQAHLQSKATILSRQEPKPIVHQATRDRAMSGASSMTSPTLSNLSEVTPPMAGHQEVVPWETDAGPYKERPDDSDKMSQVSTGRSVISNGVVDYDESIMSLARLDNFRSKANQNKANKVTQYPGVSGTSSNNSVDASDLNDSNESIPVSAAMAASKSRKSHPAQNSLARASSWKAKTSSSSSVSKQAQPAYPSGTSASKLYSKFGARQRPSWAKSSSGSTDEAPASPIPSNANSQPAASPARSTFSSASYKHERTPGSPFLPAAKFSSTRSDVGVESLPVVSTLRRDSTPATKIWKPTATKKTTIASSASVSSRQDEMRAASPSPSWHSVPDQDACPVSPTPSHVSEADSAVEKSTANVSKGRVWPGKKQPPAWIKRGPSPSVSNQSHSPASPKRSSGASWMKPGSQESETAETKQTAAPAPRPTRQFSSPPTTAEPKQTAAPVPRPTRQFSSPPTAPKPVASRPIQPAEKVERERVARSPRRHSSSPVPPSWVKPAAGEEEDAASKNETLIPKTKTWAVNKQTPAWMKKAKGGEESSEKPPVPTTKTWSTKTPTPAWIKQSTSNESEVVPTPSPRRNSTPSWLKPGQQQNSSDSKRKTTVSPQPVKEAAATVSPQTPSRGRHSPVVAKEFEASPSPGRVMLKSRRTSSGFMEQRPAPSPRSQSWKSRSSPLNVDKPVAARKAMSGDPSKMQSAASNFVKTQRSPSPGVAQLQEQIFVNKLGVSGDTIDRPRFVKPQKGPSSPSPQVKQLQKIIFSPSKGKSQSQAAEAGGRNSPAAGWWKRVPNAPEIQPQHCEAPQWKHETSSVCEEQSEVSPSPTMMSEPPPSKKTWTRPPSVGAGAPSFLKDLAAFHSTSSPRLPAEPPVFQQLPTISAQVEPRPKTPTVASTNSSPLHRKLVDEGSSELMVMPSTSTTSRDDVGTQQQEDTKSLIQMAADSVLIADYEQAMQRALVESKSDDEEESVGNSAGNALPSDLPPEFQKALTSEEKEEERPGDSQSSEATVSPPDIEVNMNCQEGSLSGDAEVLEAQEEKLPHVGHCSSDPVQPEAKHTSQELPQSSSEPVEREHSACEIVQQQEEDNGEYTAKAVVRDSPSHATAAGEHTKTKSKEKSTSNLADRARALLGWSEKRFGSKREEAYQAIGEGDYSASASTSSAPASERVEEPVSITSAAAQPAMVNNQAEHTTGTNHGSPSGVFGGIEQDENGFPCAPISREIVRFDDNEFHADAFGNQEWGDDVPEDEKKDSSDILQYWAPEVDALNDSSDWVNRDPALDAIPMNSPEPVANAEQVILTAEKMLRKWSNPESPRAEAIAPPVFTVAEEAAAAPAEPAMDKWNQNAKSPLTKEIPVPAQEHESAWDVNHHDQLAAQTHTMGNSRTPERQTTNDFLARQQAQDAAWRSPPPIDHQQNVSQQEEMAMWGTTTQAIDATWGTPQPDPFSTTNSQFEMLSARAKRPQEKDVFDPFGEEDDGFISGQLFSDATEDFVAVETFSPPTFAPVSGGKRYINSHVGAEVFDTYYHPQSVQRKPGSLEMGNDVELN